MSSFVQNKWTWKDTEVHPAVRYPSSWTNETPGDAALVNMVKNFNLRISTPKDVAGSYNEANQGFISKHPEYYVDITCNPYGDGYATLLACMNGDRYFDVVLQDIGNYKTDPTENEEVGLPTGAWGPTYEVFEGCKVIDLNERYAMGTEPTVTFSCRALRFSWKESPNTQKVGNAVDGMYKSDDDLGL
ncbi:MAG: hypothetical protein GF364_11540 [Candidatus Lokiarchaeota archaeon]|nr:hypothetical protein [Candidatus Lokiarchaeota archaeon]